jgi:hypothetical protein
MPRYITIYHVVDNADPGESDAFFLSIREAYNYAKILTYPIGPTTHKIEFNKKGIVKALNTLPWR